MGFYSGLLIGWASVLMLIGAWICWGRGLAGPRGLLPKPSPCIGPGNWYGPSRTEPPAGYQPTRPEGIADVPLEDLVPPMGGSGIVRPADHGFESLFFTKRQQVARDAEAWCDAHGIPANPFNLVTALNGLGALHAQYDPVVTEYPDYATADFKPRIG